MDSLSRKTDSAGGQVNNISPKAYNENTHLTFNSYFVLLGSDLKQSFTKPFHMSGKDWATLGKFAVVAGALSFADEPVQRFAVRLRNSNPGVANVSKYITKFGGMYEVYTLAAIGAYGFIFKNNKMQTTTLLATQAYIAGGAVESVTKFLTRRHKTILLSAGNRSRTRFLGPFAKSNNSQAAKKYIVPFLRGILRLHLQPQRYLHWNIRDKPIVPIIAYSAATMIGLSRITENKHWSTDVLAGAALGFLTGKEIVNNYHRYSKLKAPNQKKNTITFNLNYYSGHFEPGLTYKFR